MRTAKNILFNTGYQIFLVIVPLITIPYISRVIGPVGIGINAYTHSIASIFTLLGGIGISTYANRKIAYVKDDPSLMNKIFWEIMLLKLITGVISIVFYLIYLVFFAKEFQLYLIIQGILFITTIVDLHWFYRGIEEFKSIILRGMLVKIFSVSMIFILIRSPNDLWLYVLILTSSQLFGNLMLWTKIKTNVSQPKFRKSSLSQNLFGSIGLFIPQIAPRIYAIFARIMLGIMTSTTAVAFYENSDKIIRTILAVATGSGVVMLSRVSNVFVKGKHDTIRKYLIISFELVAALSFPLTFGLIAVSQLFSYLFFGENFAGIYQVLSILAPASIFVAWSTVTGVQYLIPINKVSIFTRSLLIGVIINFLLNLILIPRFGAKGVAFSTVFSEFSIVLQHLLFIRKEVKIKELIKNIWKYFVSGLIMFTVIKLFSYSFTTYSVLTLIIQILTGIIIYSICLVIFKTNAYLYSMKLLGIKKN